MKLSKAKMDTALEILAAELHSRTPAHEAHHTISMQMWGHVKSLEYTSGRLLAFGRDAEILAGAPLDAPHALGGLVIVDGAEADDDVKDQILLSGDLPGAVRWPHPDLNMRPADPAGVGLADVVIANLTAADVRLLTRDRQVDIVISHHSMIRDALTWLRPGGLLVALAHRQLLEGTDAQPRRSIAQHADLIAAARLPANALRRAPLLDSPVDLLMLRRREPGHAPSGIPFIRRTPVRVHEHPDMLINECYALAPYAVLGNIVPDPVQPDMTTATPFGGAFGVDLGDVLHEQTNTAIEDRLHAAPRPAPPSAPLPFPPATRPQRPAETDGPAL